MVITGAAGGIGSAAARAFAAAGARLLLLDVDTRAGEQLCCSLADQGHDACFREADARDPAAVADALRELADGARIDHLFHVVGGSARRLGDGPVHEASPTGWDAAIELNLRSAFICSQAVLPSMLLRGRGSITLLSSVQGIVGGGKAFDTHGYAAAKAALVGLGRAMASYYADRSIRVNVICAGTVKTAMSARTVEVPAVAHHVAMMQPLTHGPGEPDDIAAAALYLASEQARFVTGAILPVDGGWTSW